MPRRSAGSHDRKRRSSMGPECSEAPEGDTHVSLVPYQTRQPRKPSTQEKVTMSKFRILGVAALALLTLARDSTAQRGGAVRTGARGAVVGGLVGGESGAATGAKIGVVTGAARSVGQEA